MEGGENVKRGVMDDEITLKLKVFRGLGVDIERGQDGEYRKAVVRQGTKGGQMHVIELDGKFSRFFNAQYLWDTM